ncbi:MerR family transcriptional regulator [Paenibacillus sp. MMS18-CY102]|uniref:MerR family transcriptional regulator n=1 Tax=Paenibacillus sp. MMS18-CY102 TaxID=2682849 RepID=UPI00136662BB|nr:GyrI-like domain-containing protein [Paenibacillus sp. MMS18-CY102]MWC29760.1 MerR family transcriptional regulator [Paenibacillus sp. MMS18-CY102]
MKSQTNKLLLKGAFDLLTVGLLARLFGVTPKTLRHYDAIGLFTPARIGEENQYRLYAPDQLPELRRIVFLRSMGLGIEAIQELKRDGTLDDVNKISRLLRDRADGIQSEIAARQEQLVAIQRMVEYMAFTGGIPMKPTIVVNEAFTVLGMAWNSKSGEGDIPGLWQRFIPREHEIEGKLQPAVSYGICEPGEQEEFTYVAGYESHSERIPEGMAKVIVPAQRYAVFTHKGSVAQLGETYELIYSKWLPLHGLEPVKGYDFERYDERFIGPENVRSELDIYIPIA